MGTKMAVRLASKAISRGPLKRFVSTNVLLQKQKLPNEPISKIHKPSGNKGNPQIPCPCPSKNEPIFRPEGRAPRVPKCSLPPPPSLPFRPLSVEPCRSESNRKILMFPRPSPLGTAATGWTTIAGGNNAAVRSSCWCSRSLRREPVDTARRCWSRWSADSRRAMS